jgi:CHAT domain-containing protein
LHDTADELCAVAKDLRLVPDDILLGARATETALKELSRDGKLAQYRVVHFATHGTVAGEIEGTSEPGLILTPPKEQTDLDDGYLSASEVAALKLDAAWVILSACNTAAGGVPGCGGSVRPGPCLHLRGRQSPVGLPLGGEFGSNRQPRYSGRGCHFTRQEAGPR